MTVKKLRYLAYALVAVAFCACQKEPSTSGLHKDYLVYTAYDTEADFGALNTYYLPDSILLIGAADKTEYWKDDNALEIVNTVAGRMNAAGYTRTDDKEAANVGLQLSYVQKVTYFVGYDYPYWWWYYPYYWTPGYWGDWLGWHYPYRVYYGYTAGSLLIEMLDLQADQQSGKKLPVIWDSYIGGLLTSSESLNQQRTLDACRKALQYARENPELLDTLLQTKRLPLGQLTAGSGVERKTLERHRKYMVALLLIYTNGYEIIRGHLKQVMKGVAVR